LIPAPVALVKTALIMEGVFAADRGTGGFQQNTGVLKTAGIPVRLAADTAVGRKFVGGPHLIIHMAPPAICRLSSFE